MALVSAVSVGFRCAVDDMQSFHALQVWFKEASRGDQHTAFYCEICDVSDAAGRGHAVVRFAHVFSDLVAFVQRKEFDAMFKDSFIAAVRSEMQALQKHCANLLWGYRPTSARKSGLRAGHAAFPSPPSEQICAESARAICAFLCNPKSRARAFVQVMSGGGLFWCAFAQGQTLAGALSSGSAVSDSACCISPEQFVQFVEARRLEQAQVAPVSLALPQVAGESSVLLSALSS